MDDQPAWARVGLMIRIARDIGGMTPEDVGERFSESWLQTMSGYYQRLDYEAEKAGGRADVKGGTA